MPLPHSGRVCKYVSQADWERLFGDLVSVVGSNVAESDDHATLKTPAKPRRKRGRVSKSPAGRHATGDEVFKMSNSDEARNGLGTCLEFMRAHALGTSEYDPETRMFPDAERVWAASKVRLDDLMDYAGDIFPALTFRKYKQGSKGYSVDRYAETFISRQRYISWDEADRSIAFNPVMVKAMWETCNAGAEEVDRSLTHTSAFKAAFFNAVSGKPVPCIIVEWARRVVNGTAWLHMSHLKASHALVGKKDTHLYKSLTRTRDKTSITGRRIVIVPRDPPPHTPPAMGCRPGVPIPLPTFPDELDSDDDVSLPKRQRLPGMLM